MELWVRSQDEKILIKARIAVSIESVDDVMFAKGQTTETGRYFVFIDGYLMGEYESEKRAREIMEKIRDHLSIQVGYSATYCLPEK